MNKKRKCPICGEETAGIYAEGGLLLVICDECHKKYYEGRHNEIND